jgi:hypothetical protein
MLDYYNSKVLTKYCNTNNATLLVSVSLSRTLNVLPIASDSKIVLNNIVNVFYY